MLTPTQKAARLRDVTWEEIDKDSSLERELRGLFYFFFDIMMRGPNSGREITGCSFSQRGLNTLLVVKSRYEDTQQVAYCTEKYPTDCVLTFGRLDLEGRLKWHMDKFSKT